MAKDIAEIQSRSKFSESASQLAHLLQCRLAELALSDGEDAYSDHRSLTAALDRVRVAYESISNRALLLEKMKLPSGPGPDDMGE